MVLRLSDGGRISEGEPSLSERRELAALPLQPVQMGKEVMTLLAATERVAESLVRAMELKTPAVLILPNLLITS